MENQSEDLYIAVLNPNPNNMKKLALLIILAFALLNFSCEKSEECPECVPDEYYIKYHVSLLTSYTEVVRVITYTDETGQAITFVTDRTFIIDLGPVEKGFTASLSANTLGTVDNSTLMANIYASKNGDPFIVMAHGDNDTSEPVQIDCIIDF